jgi:putative ABC transport system permease protein
MLFGDPAKCLGLIFGVAFATLLMTQQATIFVGLMARTAHVILDVQEADLWVMDPSSQYIDTVFTLRDTEVQRVRGVAGVAWAVPFFKAHAGIRTAAGHLENATLLGVDDVTLVGVSRNVLLGSLEKLRDPDAIVLDKAGYLLLWPGQALELGKCVELNDRRAVVVAIVDTTPPFTTSPIVYTRYSQALRFTNNGRNQLSFVLAKASAGVDPEAVAKRIAAGTGLQALTRDQFRWKTVKYYLENTGIPASFGTVVVLGAIVGVVVVGLTFNMFVLENQKDFAALKAIGVRNPRLVGMVLVQAAVVGGTGYALGIGLAAGFFEVAPRGSPDFRGFYLPWEIAAVVAALATLIMIVSTFLSLRRVLVLDPAVVFRG